MSSGSGSSDPPGQERGTSSDGHGPSMSGASSELSHIVKTGSEANLPDRIRQRLTELAKRSRANYLVALRARTRLDQRIASLSEQLAQGKVPVTMKWGCNLKAEPYWPAHSLREMTKFVRDQELALVQKLKVACVHARDELTVQLQRRNTFAVPLELKATEKSQLDAVERVQLQLIPRMKQVYMLLVDYECREALREYALNAAFVDVKAKEKRAKKAAYQAVNDDIKGSMLKAAQAAGEAGGEAAAERMLRMAGSSKQYASSTAKASKPRAKRSFRKRGRTPGMKPKPGKGKKPQQGKRKPSQGRRKKHKKNVKPSPHHKSGKGPGRSKSSNARNHK